MQAEIKAGFLHFTVLSAREIQIPASSPHEGNQNLSKKLLEPLRGTHSPTENHQKLMTGARVLIKREGVEIYDSVCGPLSSGSQGSVLQPERGSLQVHL